MIEGVGVCSHSLKGFGNISPFIVTSESKKSWVSSHAEYILLIQFLYYIAKLYISL